MIEVDHISKFFGPVAAVRDVTFQVNKGEILGFLGPNGAGKTTTMRILTGFFPPTSGSARIGGLDVFEDSLAVRKKIGYLPENVPLYKEMIVEDYLKFVGEVKGLDGLQRKKAIGRVVESCGLDPVIKRSIKNISKGFRQRVGLAQALVGDPELLILDEPTIGLDPKQIVEIRNLIKNFTGEKTVILSTHVLPEVSMICERVVIIHQGRIVAEDTPENLSAELSGSNRVRLRSSGPPEEVRARLAEVDGVLGLAEGDGPGIFIIDIEPKEEIQPRLACAIFEAGWDLYEMSPITATLEDIFINLVTQEDKESGAANGEGVSDA
ncbi:MAG: ATP-binding cassette domain-containing protein [Deltaproteobacteria bacterium]|nr:ATP-binding cassette domain-containing protein [Deltaproteobacteria bacterium]MBW2085795.1 ATP-binding cassette domain-containing protein [Deltaproteobacteria bacterium]